MRQEDTDPMKKTIYLAGGCFWGCQKYFDRLPGVVETEVGYANGRTERGEIYGADNQVT